MRLDEIDTRRDGDKFIATICERCAWAKVGPCSGSYEIEATGTGTTEEKSRINAIRALAEVHADIDRDNHNYRELIKEFGSQPA